MTSDATRTRLLDATEQLLASTSYDDLRVRAVCARAELNPAAVHYHFGSKQRLVAALLESRLEPVWAAPLDALSRRTPSVREIVDAIIDPLVDLLDEPERAAHLRLLGRFVLAHPDSEWTATWFSIDAWAAMLTSAAGVDGPTARRRWRFAFTVLMTELAATVTPGARTVAAMRDFLTAGLQAPSSNPRPSPDAAERSTSS